MASYVVRQIGDQKRWKVIRTPSPIARWLGGTTTETEVYERAGFLLVEPDGKALRHVPHGDDIGDAIRHRPIVAAQVPVARVVTEEARRG